MPASRRAHLIDTAIDVLYREGFHATGLDRILEQGGLSRMTVYNHFKSKDELILAALLNRDAIFRARLREFVESRAATPRERLLAVFDFHADWFASKEFFGCMFIKALGEFPDPASGPNRIASQHKQAITTYLRELCQEAAIRDADGVARQMSLLLEGAIVTAQFSASGPGPGHDSAGAASIARCIAERLLAASPSV